MHLQVFNMSSSPFTNLGNLDTEAIYENKENEYQTNITNETSNVQNLSSGNDDQQYPNSTNDDANNGLTASQAKLQDIAAVTLFQDNNISTTTLAPPSPSPLRLNEAPRRRGRPRKYPPKPIDEGSEPIIKRKRGRPPKIKSSSPSTKLDDPLKPKRGRGRPRLHPLPVVQPSVDEGTTQNNLQMGLGEPNIIEGFAEGHANLSELKPKRGRGRPRKIKPEEGSSSQNGLSPLVVLPAKRGRGRPPLHRSEQKIANTPISNNVTVESTGTNLHTHSQLNPENEQSSSEFYSLNPQSEIRKEVVVTDQPLFSTADVPVKRKRGRPPLNKPKILFGTSTENKIDENRPKRGRGRPRLERPGGLPLDSKSQSLFKRKRGRPPKIASGIVPLSAFTRKHEDMLHDSDALSLKHFAITSPNNQQFLNNQQRESAPLLPRKRGRPPKKRQENAEIRNITPGLTDSSVHSSSATPQSESSSPNSVSPLLPSSDRLPLLRQSQFTPPPKKPNFEVAIISPKKSQHKLYPNPVVESVFNDVPYSEIDSQLHTIKSTIAARLCGKSHIPLVGHMDEQTKLYQWVRQTIVLGEGNSVIIVGPRGSGKSVLVDDILSRAAQEINEKSYVVRLNGTYQTDDKLALREISRQLSIELESIESEEALKSEMNFSDTLTKLLATLSHPVDLGIAEDVMTTSAAVIFVLEEFDLFVQHSRQMLLYNLFDIAQSRKAPILIIGLTTRYDCSESLEKRVKSRFSHMVIPMRPPSSLSEFEQILKSVLYVSDEGGKDQIITCWNQRVDELLSDTRSHLHKLVQHHYFASRNLKLLYVDLLFPILSMAPDRPLLADEDFANISLKVSDHKVELVKNLSLLELALLICAVRFEARDIPACNFNSAYQEYRQLHQSSVINAAASGALAHSSRLWGRDVALEAWETLGSIGLIIPVHPSTNVSGALSRQCQLWQPEVDINVVSVGLREHRRLPSHYYRWLKEVI